MKLKFIFVLFALSATAQAQWAVAARGLYQPVLLSIGAIFTAIHSKSKSEDGDDEEDWLSISKKNLEMFKNREVKVKKESEIEMTEEDEENEQDNSKPWWKNEKTEKVIKDDWLDEDSETDFIADWADDDNEEFS